MVLVPKRITLVAQVANSVRDSLTAKEWIGRLPAEKELAEQVQVSRMTLRAALKIIAAEGLIEVTHGRRAKIVAGIKANRRLRRGRVVGLLLPPALRTLPYGNFGDRYRSLLEKTGIRTKAFFGWSYYRPQSSELLENLVREANADFWVLIMSNHHIQRWFSRRQIPALVYGSCQEGVILPALDVDYHALCSHAIGTLLRLGHRRITYLSEKSEAAGDLVCERSFGKAIETYAYPDLRSDVVHCENSASGVNATLTRLFHSRFAPTALLIGRAGITLATLTYLLSHGIRVPRDVCLVSREDAPYLAYLIPSIARYRFNPNTYAKRMVQMTQNHFEGTLQPVQQFILPAFLKGDSLAISTA